MPVLAFRTRLKPAEALEASAADRRRKHVVLTRQGGARLLETHKLWRKAHRRFEKVFGADEAGALRKTLLAVACNGRLSGCGIDR